MLIIATTSKIPLVNSLCQTILSVPSVVVYMGALRPDGIVITIKTYSIRNYK